MLNIVHKYQSTGNRIGWHILFWACYIAMYTIIYGSYADSYGAEFFWAMAYLPLKIAAAYFVLYFVIPRYFLQKKYVTATIITGLAILIAAVFQRVLDYHYFYPMYHHEWMSGGVFNISKILKTTLSIYPAVALAAFIKITKYFYSEESKSKELRQEKLQAELNFLKGQIHPHFLFNTLNNLYALTLKKSENSPEVVLKLSELLSFMLYECNSRTVPLSKELKLIENYIALEKIRYDDRLTITYETEGDVSKNQIPPMLLLPFVENAFKHGTSDSIDEVWVDIHIKVEGRSLSLSVNNSNGYDTVEKNEFDYQKGIGLKNVHRRLELLYEDHYTLETNDTEHQYSVSLTIELDELLDPDTV
jgi:two-component system LytT family sensor kinase